MNTNELETITARQLRQILYFVQNGNQTVEELRRELFKVAEQDKPVAIGFGMIARMSQDTRPRETGEAQN